MIRHQHTLVTGHRPPYPALLSTSVLRLASIDSGSCSVTLDIAGPMTLGQLADAPLAGLSALLASADDIRALPKEVSFPLRQITEGLPDGISVVVIAGTAELSALTLTRELFDDGPTPLKTVRRHGRLREINWSRGTAELGSPAGKTLLVFQPDAAEKMHQAGNRLIGVIGNAELTPDGVAIIREIESIEITAEKDHWLGGIGPLEEDVQQALAIIRWQEKQRERFYDDELDAWADELLKDALKE